MLTSKFMPSIGTAFCMSGCLSEPALERVSPKLLHALERADVGYEMADRCEYALKYDAENNSSFSARDKKIASFSAEVFGRYAKRVETDAYANANQQVIKSIKRRNAVKGTRPPWDGLAASCAFVLSSAQKAVK